MSLLTLLRMAPWIAILVLLGYSIQMKETAGKWKASAQAAHAKLNNISSKRNQQKSETKERIKIVTQTIRVAEDKAGVVEKAPLPGQCRTPDAILRADI